MYAEAPKTTCVNEDPFITEILKERQQIQKWLEGLQRQRSLLKKEIVAAKKALRRNALLLKARERALRVRR